MAKKPVKAKAAKKPAKPAKKVAVKAKPTKPAKANKPAKAGKAAKSGGLAKKAKVSKPAAKPAKSVKTKPAAAKKAAKPVAKAKPTKPVAKAKAAKPAKQAKPAKAVKPAKATKPAKPVKAAKPAKTIKVAKPAVASKKAEKPMAVKTAPQPKLVERKTEPARAAEPAKPVTPVKTVEQIMHEKSKAVTAQAGKLVAKKEELFVPKYQLPTPVEVVKPLRLKPVATDEKANTKPVANPIYVAPQREGQAPIKFAPMAIVERAPEKEKKQIQEDSEDMKTSPRLAFKEGDDKKGGVSIEDKLRALYDIQLIDTRIDKMHAMRGELPLEVEDLEAEVEGLETRITNLNNEVKHVDNEIANKKIGIKDSEGLIKKYKEQLNNVKNNREFDSLNKEVEFQELEIVLHNKRIKEFQTQKTTKEELLTTAEAKVKERKNDLKIKKNELNEIIKETEKEEKILRKKGDEARKVIEERLLSAYERIRSGAPNKMAVVPIEREASAGSFIQLPPQKQLDVAARKRVIVDEHSGRILVDAELAREEQEKMDALLDKELRKA